MMGMTGHAVLVTMAVAAVGVAICILWTRRKRAMAGGTNE
jgi:hypothetical protein